MVRSTVRDAVIVLALAAGLAACATPRDADRHPAGDPPGASGPALPFDSCADRSTLEADPSFYRDEPRYELRDDESSDRPLDVLDAAVAWAEGQPGFEQPWLDHAHNGWIHLGFSGDVDAVALQDAVEREFPGEGVVVVDLPYSQAELDDLADRVWEALDAAGATWAGSSSDAAYGVVSIDALAPEEAAFDALAAFEGEPLCLDVLPGDSFVAEGDQPTSGAGWRLLGEEWGAGESYRTGIATTDEQLATLWAASGLPGEPGAVDWQREIVVWFGTAQSSSCPERLDGVVVTGSLVHADLVMPGWPGACTADANPHAFVIAVERSLLPEGPFDLQLDAEEPPPGAPEERTEVDVDLRSPGSTLN